MVAAWRRGSAARKNASVVALHYFAERQRARLRVSSNFRSRPIKQRLRRARARLRDEGDRLMQKHHRQIASVEHPRIRRRVTFFIALRAGDQTPCRQMLARIAGTGARATTMGTEPRVRRRFAVCVARHSADHRDRTRRLCRCRRCCWMRAPTSTGSAAASRRIARVGGRPARSRRNICTNCCAAARTRTSWRHRQYAVARCRDARSHCDIAIESAGARRAHRRSRSAWTDAGGLGEHERPRRARFADRIART